MPLLLDDAEDLVGSPVILLLSASGVLDDDGLEAADEGELLDAPMDCVPELLCADALDLLGSSDILALSDDEDEDDDVEGELLLLAGVLALLLLEEGVLLLVVDGVVLEDGVLLDAPIDWVLDEPSFADWAVLFSADLRSESSLAASILSLAFSAPCLVLSPIFLNVSLILSVMDSPDEWLSVAAGVEPGLSCWARAPVPATASVQARAMKVRFMGNLLAWRDAESDRASVR
ncbi:MAG TPA: hypothetical protein VGF26_05910 [Ramlibacter sp.]